MPAMRERRSLNSILARLCRKLVKSTAVAGDTELQPLDFAGRAFQAIGQLFRRQPRLIEALLQLRLAVDVQRAQAAQHECRAEPCARLGRDDAGIGIEVLSRRLRGKSADEERGGRGQGGEQAAHDAVLAGHQQHRHPERVGHVAGTGGATEQQGSNSEIAISRPSVSGTNQRQSDSDIISVSDRSRVLWNQCTGARPERLLGRGFGRNKLPALMASPVLLGISPDARDDIRVIRRRRLPPRLASRAVLPMMLWSSPGRRRAGYGRDGDALARHPRSKDPNSVLSSVGRPLHMLTMPRGVGIFRQAPERRRDVLDIDEVAEHMKFRVCSTPCEPGMIAICRANSPRARWLGIPGPIGLKIRATNTGVAVASPNVRACLGQRQLGCPIGGDRGAARRLGHRHAVDDRRAVLRRAAAANQEGMHLGDAERLHDGARDLHVQLLELRRGPDHATDQVEHDVRHGCLDNPGEAGRRSRVRRPSRPRLVPPGGRAGVTAW